MNIVREDCSKDISQGKYFNDDGSIEEGDMDTIYGLMINGYLWKLQDDGSHNKYKVVGKESSEFICNERLY